MALTIEQLKKKKEAAEDKILEILRDFEKADSDIYVSYIDVYRKPKKKSNSKFEDKITPEPERTGPIYDVQIRLRFEL